LTNNEIQKFIKKLVEPGTEDRFTLLADKKYLREPQTIQKLMKESIFVENNTCRHRYNITIGEFIQSPKVCKTCFSTQISSLSSRKIVIYNSLHNTQAI